MKIYRVEKFFSGKGLNNFKIHGLPSITFSVFENSAEYSSSTSKQGFFIVAINKVNSSPLYNQNNLLDLIAFSPHMNADFSSFTVTVINSIRN